MEGINEGVVRRPNGNGNVNAVFLAPTIPLTPGFPLTAEFKALKQREISVFSVWHEEKKDSWKQIPLVIKSK
jgi:hypothetical protein